MALNVPKFAFEGAYAEQVHKAMGKYPHDRRQSAVLALLDLSQRQAGGSVPPGAVEAISEMLGMAPIRVIEVATFFTMINLQPVGRYHLQMCGTTPCMLCGADDIVEATERHLGIKRGETTQDGLFTMSVVECLGACCNAPMVQINDDYYEDLTPETFISLLDKLKAGEPITPGSQAGRTCSQGKDGPTTLTTLTFGQPGGGD